MTVLLVVITMEVKQTFDPEAPLGTTADYVSEHVKEIYRAHRLKNPDNQHLIEKCNFLLKPWAGIPHLEEFPDPIKKPLEKARATILILKTDIDHEPKKDSNVEKTDDEITWLNRILQDMEILQSCYQEFLGATHMLEDFPACTEILPLSSSGASFWVQTFGKKHEIPAPRFADTLMLYFANDLNNNNHTFMGHDKQIVKDFLVRGCSDDYHGKIVTVRSFTNFLRWKSNPQLQKDGLQLRDVLEHALKAVASPRVRRKSLARRHSTSTTQPLPTRTLISTSRRHSTGPIPDENGKDKTY